MARSRKPRETFVSMLSINCSTCISFNVSGKYLSMRGRVSASLGLRATAPLLARKRKKIFSATTINLIDEAESPERFRSARYSLMSGRETWEQLSILCFLAHQSANSESERWVDSWSFSERPRSTAKKRMNESIAWSTCERLREKPFVGNQSQPLCEPTEPTEGPIDLPRTSTP